LVSVKSSILNDNIDEELLPPNDKSSSLSLSITSVSLIVSVGRANESSSEQNKSCDDDIDTDDKESRGSIEGFVCDRGTVQKDDMVVCDKSRRESCDNCNMDEKDGDIDVLFGTTSTSILSGVWSYSL
jgi:hypothetical protein